MNWNEIINDANDYIINKEIDNYLKTKDFQLKSPICRCKDYSMGWQIGYFSEDRMYYSYIHINKNRIVYYKEYECGGMVDEWEKEIEDKSVFDSIKSFNEFMDSQYFR
jgi:hypothetical protein